MFSFDPQLLPFITLYAEIHFKFFKFFPSFLFKNLPEIIFDCPRRLEPGHDLPVLLLIHDCKQFPIELNDVSITVSGMGFLPLLLNFKTFDQHELIHSLPQNFRAFIFSIPRDKLPEDELFINAKITVTDKRGKQHIILNDNLPTSSKLPFSCRISPVSLPGVQHCAYGDFHVHSSYSESHVEFGPPVEAISHIAKAAGLAVISITDHSYDLACSVDNYLLQDPTQQRWKLFCEETNVSFSTIVLRGEEVSCLNSQNQVVHLCGTNLTDFIPGTLDGARKNTNFTAQLTIPQTIEEIHRQGGLAYAAHPGSKKSFLQGLFLRRGMWSEQDCTCELDGFQAYNSGVNQTWDRAILLWKKMLAKGYKTPILAGNDAHGDFNRYRAIGIPFVSIHEEFDRCLGTGKTGIYGCIKTKTDVVNSIKSGKTFITTGPYLSINCTESPVDYAISKAGIDFSQFSLFIHAISTIEFGRLQKVAVYGYDVSSKSEQIIFTRTYQIPLYEIIDKIESCILEQCTYIRGELWSITEKGFIHKAFTSGCYNTRKLP